MAVAGVDFILLPSRVASALSAIVTVQGYNDGLHATASADAMPSAGMDIALSAESAKAMAPEKVSRGVPIMIPLISFCRVPQHVFKIQSESSRVHHKWLKG